MEGVNTPTITEQHHSTSYFLHVSTVGLPKYRGQHCDYMYLNDEAMSSMRVSNFGITAAVPAI